MKKFAGLFLALCLILTFSIAAAEETAEKAPIVHTSGDYEYILLPDGTAEITQYWGKTTELTIPSALDDYIVTGIGEEAFFMRRDYLTSINIPDSVISIGNLAFYGCKSLTSITIPDSVTHMGSNPFKYCENLKEIYVSPDHPTLATIDGVLFDKTEKKLICYPCAFSAKSYSIPHGIRAIGDDAFFYCNSLTSISIPDSVTSIGDEVFAYCISLKSITIPNSATSIGDNAFYFCASLASISIPDSVTSIGEMAFNKCSFLTDITIPNSVINIGENAFIDCSENLILTVGRDSYARQYAIDNKLKYTYPDANALDWLNN
ncbi:MAG: leucine-rich repeat domain-containing protein [Clostridia bacterium]|nr:leucine-rich repeat domain-containing protein [Clostridia bacterium]MBR6810243.1 leucine-rich repeat domain-containing protein [Clostridia bacterium]